MNPSETKSSLVLMGKNMGRLYFCVGLPRCGKSTYCDIWVNQTTPVAHKGWNTCTFPMPMLPRVIVCADDIRLCLTGQRFQKLAEDFVHSTKNIMIRSLLKRGFDVIVDGTHTTEKSIRDLFLINPMAKPIVFDVDKLECQRRAVESGQEDLVPVIEKMSVQLKGLLADFDNTINKIKASI